MKTVIASSSSNRRPDTEVKRTIDRQVRTVFFLLIFAFLHLALPTIWSAWFLKCSVSSIVASPRRDLSVCAVFHHLPDRLLITSRSYRKIVQIWRKEEARLIAGFFGTKPTAIVFVFKGYWQKRLEPVEFSLCSLSLKWCKESQSPRMTPAELEWSKSTVFFRFLCPNHKWPRSSKK